jgi:hypothetical protein
MPVEVLRAARDVSHSSMSQSRAVL